MHEAQKKHHPKRDSSCGRCHTFMNVGVAPTSPVSCAIRIPSTGLSKAHQSPTPTMAPASVQPSIFVHPGFPYFKESRKTRHAPANAPTICPLTDCLAYI